VVVLLYASKIEIFVIFLSSKLARDRLEIVTSWVRTNFYSSTINSTLYELARIFVWAELSQIKPAQARLFCSPRSTMKAQHLAKICTLSSTSWTLFQLTSPLWSCLDLKPTIYMTIQAILRRGGRERENTEYRSEDYEDRRGDGGRVLSVGPTPPSKPSPSSPWWRRSCSSLDYGIVKVTCINLSNVLHELVTWDAYHDCDPICIRYPYGGFFFVFEIIYEMQIDSCYWCIDTCICYPIHVCFVLIKLVC
jgi:hypothetical protein